MKDLITSSEAPSCRNSSYETYELTQKNCYRKHLNFLDIDPSFDFQILADCKSQKSQSAQRFFNKKQLIFLRFCYII